MDTISNGNRAHNFKNLTGKVYGRLFVVGLDQTYKDSLRYVCVCECGNICVKRATALRSNTRSCGCIRKEAAARNIRHIIKDATEQAAFNKLFREYVGSAKQRGYTFNLTVEQFNTLIHGVCYYCGDRPNKQQKTYTRSGVYIIYNGIDRVNNTVGYEYTNCVSCCTVCNLAKRSMSEQDFYLWVNKVYTHIKDRL